MKLSALLPIIGNASVAEHAVSLLFAMAHTIVEGDRNVRRGKWFDGLNYMRWHLTGRTLGLVG